MFRKGLTLIFVPSEGHSIRKLRLRALPLALAVLAVIGLSTAAFFYGQEYLNLKKEMPDVSRLEKENQHQQAQILAFAQKIGQLKGEMEKLNQFNKKLKNMLALSDQESDRFVGQGGPATALNKPKTAIAYQKKEMIRRMHDDLSSLGQEASLVEQSQQELHTYLQSRKSILAATPSILPSRGWVTSGFGYRRSPFTGKKEFHKGLDIANRKGTPILAPASGVVAQVGWENGYGKCITIHHGYGLSTKYAHLSKFLVKPGEAIKRGQAIAKMGSTGRSTGSHLHYEVHLNGVPTNPSRFVLNK